MKLPARTIWMTGLLLATACSTGPYSLSSQLSRRLGNIGERLAPESLTRTVSTRISNMAATTGKMVQVPTRLTQLDAGIRGTVGNELDRTGGLPDSVSSFVGTSVNRLDRTVRNFSDPSPAWREHLSPTRLLERLDNALRHVGVVLGLDRRILPMLDDPERQTDPQQPPRPTPNLWDRILYRLRL